MFERPDTTEQRDVNLVDGIERFLASGWIAGLDRDPQTDQDRQRGILSGFAAWCQEQQLQEWPQVSRTTISAYVTNHPELKPATINHCSCLRISEADVIQECRSWIAAQARSELSTAAAI